MREGGVGRERYRGGREADMYLIHGLLIVS